MKLLSSVLALATMARAVDITSDSVLGKKLMAKARPLNTGETEGRALENNNYYTSWMTKYSMKFDGCHSVPQFEREEGMRSMLLAKFKMCPSDNCDSCPNAGEYIVEMKDFVEAYTEAKQTINEYACETQQETCEYQCENGMYNYQNGDDQNANYNNNNGDDDNYCYSTCMSDSGLSYCDNDNGDNDQNMDELMECRQLGGDDNNNNNNNQNYNSNYPVYYVGAYCKGKSGVYVGTFTDSSCSKFAPSGTYEKYTGYSLPTQNFVGSDCISCKSPDNDNNNNNGDDNNNNNNNNNGNYEEVFEVCEEIYEDAGKCEQKLDTQYPNNQACELMHNTLKRLDAAYKGKRPASFGLAWFFGLSCMGLVSYVAWIHTKISNRQQINLLPPLNGSSA